MTGAPHWAGWTLIALGFALVVINIGLAAKLLDLQSTNYAGCVYGNELRADARLLLNEGGHPGLADDDALANRNCKELYGKGLRP